MMPGLSFSSKKKGRRQAVTEKPKPVAAQAVKDPLESFARSDFLESAGYYGTQATMLRSTTAQTGGLHLAIAEAPTSARGIFCGQDATTGWPVFHDEVTGYRIKTISSPNVVIIGDLGVGKSHFMKTWGVMRHLALGRRVVVIDKKMQATDQEDRDHEGEYAKLARTLGIEPIRFTGQVGGLKVNPLDPSITSSGTLAAGQTELLKAILAEIIQRPLNARESKALRVAHAAALERSEREQREPVINDVVHFLLSPDPKVVAQQRGSFTTSDYLEWGTDIGFALEECIDGDLKGLIDGPTSSEIRLNSGLTVFDISALPDNGPAVPVVMAIINTWVRNVIVQQKKIVPTLFCVEEGWHLVTGNFAKISQQNTKKSRGLAFGTATAYQHISDVPSDSPAIATIKEAGTVLLFKQARRDDAEQCQRLFGLHPALVETIMKLPQGCALLLIGSRPPIVLKAIGSELELELANTDSALHSRAQTGLDGQVLGAVEKEGAIA
ncbi:ATP-binding protein [Dermabacteraceae bacterium TAE3-ERU27]|nr:ATP-binding protein [Dermabacteraceae bacterium TAE3-ERU27]